MLTIIQLLTLLVHLTLWAYTVYLHPAVCRKFGVCTSVTNTTHQNRTVTSDGCVHVQHAQQGMSKCVIVCVGCQMSQWFRRFSLLSHIASVCACDCDDNALGWVSSTWGTAIQFHSLDWSSHSIQTHTDMHTHTCTWRHRRISSY